MTDWHGRVVLVTGGAHRLGKAIALAFGRAGASVVIHYHRSEQAAQDTLAELRALGVEATAVGGDLADTAAAPHVADAAVAAWGRLDALVNSAGAWNATPFGTITEAQWDALLHANLRGAFFLTQRAAPALRATHGAVVNIADIGVEQPWRNHAPYLISKGGLVAMTTVLARELAPHVRVNAVAPGVVLPPDDWTPQQAARAVRSIPLGRVGTAEDVADAAVFLAGARYITGVILPVDGGKLLH